MIINVNDLKKDYSHDDIVEEFCNRIQEKICKANSEGRHCICFYESCIAYDKKSHKFVWSTSPEVKGEPYYHFDNFRDEVASKFLTAGYKIKPTGYIGGVWQLTEDIYW